MRRGALRRGKCERRGVCYGLYAWVIVSTDA
jgi:hypothetical protein